MKRELIIQLDDKEDDEMIVERVLELLSEGYTSGYGPFWEIKETEK